MSKKCDFCKRSATRGALRSHSKVRTLKRQNINLQSRTIDGVKFKLCMACIRTMAKPPKVKKPRIGKPKVAKVSKVPKKVRKIKD